MGRHRIHARRWEHGYWGGPRWPDPTYCEWEPGALLGSDDVQKEVSDSEMTLIRCLRRLRIAPDEALVRLTTGG